MSGSVHLCLPVTLTQCPDFRTNTRDNGGISRICPVAQIQFRSQYRAPQNPRKSAGFLLVESDRAICVQHRHAWRSLRSTREGLDEPQKVALSISLNIDRRQLSRQQKRDIIAASLKAEPEASNREHARRTGVSHHTVESVRDDLESTGQVAQLEKTRGADGRERTTSPERPVVQIKTKTSEEVTETFDAGTGEVIDLPAPQSLNESRYITAFVGALVKANKVLEFDAERIAQFGDQDVLRSVELYADSVARFAKRVGSARGLRAINGGK